MDYLFQKIKTLGRLEPTPKMHRDIMRRVLYLRFRKFKEPFLILAYLGSLSLVIDAWHLLNLKGRAMQGLIVNTDWGGAAFLKLPAAIIAKGMNNPDLLISFAADALIVAYLLYLFIRFDKIFNPLNAQNKMRWYEFIFRIFRVAKN
ncbi:hypothetical protein HYV91_01525 [Candidatus Wolfebacteria bacterium]|nr:hypothetical protein [Candidatus Wolfebacteria bacterium]